MFTDNTTRPTAYQCPSAQPNMRGAKVLGVVERHNERLEILYLDRLAPVSPDLLALTGDVEPTKIFRVAAMCAENRCQHFDGDRCRLAQRIVQLLPPVVDQLPRCSIRADCRWYAEEGAAACRRCPQIMTLNDSDDPRLTQVAGEPNVSDAQEISGASGQLAENIRREPLSACSSPT